MKYTSTKGHSVGVKRTLMAFEDAMFNLLGKQTFEKVSVSEIC